MDKEPIAIDPADDTVILEPASRIDFSVRHPVRHDLRVKDLGKVCEEDMPDFICYAMEYWDTDHSLS